MPNNEVAVDMEKHIKHDSPVGGNCNSSNTTSSSSSNNNTNNSNSSTTREAKNSSPVFLMPLSKKVDSPLYKHQGQKWEKVIDFDKMLKQIRNAERYYLRGLKPSGGTSGYARRVQPQVQRLNAGDMHFYGMVPKKPTDVVVCDICLGIYTKMGFNNHMRLHHPQAWNTVSSKSAAAATVSSSSGASTSKDAAYHSAVAAGGSASNTNKDNNQEITREISASGNPLAESTANATPAATSSANTSRHKSFKSGSSGGSSRSRSKSKHHHHHHQQQTSTASTSSATTSSAVASSSATQAPASNTEVSSSHATSSSGGSSSSSKSSKKSASSLNSVGNSDSKQSHSVGVPKEESSTVQPISSSPSNSSNSLPATPKMSSAEITVVPEATPIPSSSYAAKEKTKASKRKSKNSSATAAAVAAAYTAPEINESSNSSIEFPPIASNPAVNTTSSKSSKRSSRSKSGKDLKQLLAEPQLSELDQAVSSITGGQIDAINDSNTNSNDREDVSFNIATDGNSLQSVQQPQFNSIQILQEGNVNLQQQQQTQLQHQNSNDNDNSMLTLDDMLDSKFIHEILNTDESEIHFDESELDKATAAQQQPQHQAAYLQQQSQQTPSKRMRYDDRLATTTEPAITGTFAAFQQQQQQMQQPFHVTNLDDIKMYTTAIDAQQYLNTQQSQQQQIPQDRHQITTIDTLQLQQLLYQQQQQQQQVQQHQSGLNTYAVDELNAAAGTLEQQQQYNNADVIMCSAEQLHKEGKINAADYATLTALSNNDGYGNVSSSICGVNAADAAAAAQFQVYNIPSLTDDDDDGVDGVTNMIDSKLNNVIVPQNHYVLPGADGNDEEQLIYEITANNQVALISQQRQQQMIAEFLTQAGYDNMENVNVNINANGNADAADIKPTITADGAIDSTDDLLDFDFSRIETVSSVSSSSSSSSENKTNIKTETRSDKYMSTASLPDDMFLNVFLYAGLPRPLALNSFGLVKLPQSVATTFRKNLHATRKANNSPVYSLSGSGSPAVTARFGSNATNAKSTAAQSYFTALGTNSGGGVFNEFSSIGSITITNQSSTSQQQKQNSHNDFNATGSNANGLLASSPANAANSPTTTTATTGSGSRISRPKSAGSNSSNAGAQSKSKHYSSSSSNANNNNNNNNSSSFQLPQSQPKTIFVNTNLAAAVASNSDKFIKRSLISKACRPLRTGTTFTAKQLSEILLHPGKDSKEKYLQLLNARGDQQQQQQQDNKVDVTVLEHQQQQQQQQRLEHVKNFYERRKKLLNASANAASTASGGYNLARRLNGTQLNCSDSASTSSPAALKQKLLRERLLRTLSDCGINSIKTNSSSPQNSGSNDILRVLA